MTSTATTPTNPLIRATFEDAKKALDEAEAAAKKGNLGDALLRWGAYRHNAGFLAGLEEGGVRGFAPYRGAMDDLKFKSASVRDLIVKTFRVKV